MAEALCATFGDALALLRQEGVAGSADAKGHTVEVEPGAERLVIVLARRGPGEERDPEVTLQPPAGATIGATLAAADAYCQIH